MCISLDVILPWHQIVSRQAGKEVDRCTNTDTDTDTFTQRRMPAREHAWHGNPLGGCCGCLSLRLPHRSTPSSAIALAATPHPRVVCLLASHALLGVVRVLLAIVIIATIFACLACDCLRLLAIACDCLLHSHCVTSSLPSSLVESL